MTIEIALGESPTIRQALYNKDDVAGRGKKQCPSCQSYMAAALRSCPYCEHSFYTVKKPKKSKRFQEVHWTDVKVGMLIYVENSDVWVNPEGEPTPMGETGEFLVKGIRHDGLVLYNKKWGYSFQNMKDIGYNEKTGITRGRAKIYKK